RDDLTVPRVEVARGTAEGRRGKGKQTRPRCRSRLSNLNAADHDPRAAAGRSLIGREGGVALDQRNALGREAELLCDDLAERGARPRAEVDLAGEHRDAAVRRDAQI